MAEQDKSGARWRWLWLLPLALALVLRLSYQRTVATLPEYRAPQVDAAYNSAWAEAWASGQWDKAAPAFALAEAPHAPYFRPPGYGWFLGVVRLVAGRTGFAAVARLAQVALGLATVWLVLQLARRWAGPGRGQELAGILAGTLAALYWPFIYFEGELLDTALLTFLMAALLLALERGHGGWGALGCGILAGCFCVVRPNLLLALPLLALARGWGAAAWRWALPLLAGVLLVVLPVTLRNRLAGGAWVLISSNAGINLYIGNQPAATGVFSSDLGPWGRYGNNADFRHIYKRIALVTGYEHDYAAASRFLGRQAWRAMRRDPARLLRLSARKVLLLLGPVETGLNGEPEWARTQTPLLRRLPGFGWVLPLGLLGGVWAWRRAALWAVALPYAVSFIPFFVAGQYRTVLAVPLLVLAGVGVARAGALARRWLPLVVLPLALGALLALNLAGYQFGATDGWFSRGNAWRALGETERACTAWREALRQAARGTAAERRLGVEAAKSGSVACLRQGDAAGALAFTTAGLALAPQNRELQANHRAALQWHSGAETPPP